MPRRKSKGLFTRLQHSIERTDGAFRLILRLLGLYIDFLDSGSGFPAICRLAVIVIS